MEDRNYIQCQNCGCIYCINDNFSIEEFIVESECPVCKHTSGINCGENPEDVYMFMDINNDPRYYLY